MLLIISQPTNKFHAWCAPKRLDVRNLEGALRRTTDVSETSENSVIVMAEKLLITIIVFGG